MKCCILFGLRVYGFQAFYPNMEFAKSGLPSLLIRAAYVYLGLSLGSTKQRWWYDRNTRDLKKIPFSLVVTAVIYHSLVL